MTTRIWVDRGAAYRGEPPLVVCAEDGSETHAESVYIAGPSRVVYEPHAPFKPAGPVIWIETDSIVGAT